MQTAFSSSLNSCNLGLMGLNIVCSSIVHDFVIKHFIALWSVCCIAVFLFFFPQTSVCIERFYRHSSYQTSTMACSGIGNIGGWQLSIQCVISNCSHHSCFDKWLLDTPALWHKPFSSLVHLRFPVSQEPCHLQKYWRWLLLWGASVMDKRLATEHLQASKMDLWGDLNYDSCWIKLNIWMRPNNVCTSYWNWSTLVWCQVLYEAVQDGTEKEQKYTLPFAAGNLMQVYDIGFEQCTSIINLSTQRHSTAPWRTLVVNYQLWLPVKIQQCVHIIFAQDMVPCLNRQWNETSTEAGKREKNHTKNHLEIFLRFGKAKSTMAQSGRSPTGISVL